MQPDDDGWQPYSRLVRADVRHKGEVLAKELCGIGVTGSNQSNDDLKRLAWGRVDVLVNSAGHGPREQILKFTDEQWGGWTRICST